MISDIEKAKVEFRFGTLMNQYAEDEGSESSGNFMAGVLFGARLHKLSPDATDVVLSKIEREIGDSTEIAPERMEVLVRQIADHVSES